MVAGQQIFNIRSRRFNQSTLLLKLQITPPFKTKKIWNLKLFPHTIVAANFPVPS